MGIRLRNTTPKNPERVPETPKKIEAALTQIFFQIDTRVAVRRTMKLV